MNNIDYQFSNADADWLKGISLHPDEIRLQALNQYAEKNGPEALLNLFSQFIGLANSVVHNNREMVELYLVTDCDHHPYAADKINLPTIFGALNGVALANGIDPAKTCPGCAFRSGTCANQSPVTSCDADWAVRGEIDFMCHDHLGENGKPDRKCIGFSKSKHRDGINSGEFGFNQDVEKL